MPLRIHESLFVLSGIPVDIIIDSDFRVLGECEKVQLPSTTGLKKIRALFVVGFVSAAIRDIFGTV